MKHNKYEYVFNRLNYVIQRECILFTCDSIVEEYRNSAAAGLINDLLLEFSKGHSVFYTAYRLRKNADVSRLIEPNVILERATALFNPFYTCIHLSEAKIDIVENDECDVYFFEKDVEWPDFLVSDIRVKDLQELMKNGRLCAYLEIYHQSEYGFRCSKAYEGRLKLFFEDMANAGYEVSEGRNESHIFWIREGAGSGNGFSMPDKQ